MALTKACQRLIRVKREWLLCDQVVSHTFVLTLALGRSENAPRIDQLARAGDSIAVLKHL
jgi:hypothetical protein